ncbi:MAG TPA: PQQ-binding-like beta-propeller repeat protein [Candidatus Polarisedimenticolaceae bacterium]|nr:PQQ-binding-like beta-propeller repeat protein [Candidatus Polarisedimenticolaceae bacterium]
MMRLLAVLILGATPVLAQATFHGDAARTGAYPTPGPTTSPTTTWTFKTGGPIVGSPVIQDGVVYVASLDTQLYAIEQDSGKEKWKFKSRMPIASTPAVADGTLYFVSSTGALAAIDTANGQPKWVFVAEYERKFEAKNLHGYPSAAQTIPDAWDIFTSSPALANGKVYFGSGDGNVYAVDAKTGLLQWKFPTNDVIHASPAVANNTVYIGSWDSSLYALDADSGQLKWSFAAGQDAAIHNQVGFQSSPAVVDGVVYVGCRDAHVYALDAASGRKKWDYPTSKSWVIGTPAVRDGVVYVGTSDSARFMALDARSGRLKFNFNAKAYVFSSAAIAGGLVYFGNHAGRIQAVDARTGTLAWEFQTEGSKQDPLKVLTPDGGLNQEAFAPLFHDFEDMYLDFYRFASVGAILSSPAVDRGVLYVGSMDGTLYALQ